MEGYVCLVLDKDTNITSATVVRGTLAEAVETAQQITIAAGGSGYEIWHKNRRISSFFPLPAAAPIRPPASAPSDRLPD